MDKQLHWNTIYSQKSEDDLSWHQDDPSISLELMKGAGLTPQSSVIDIGAGTSRVVDRLLAFGLRDITALDLSRSALVKAQGRLGERGEIVRWIAADVTRWETSRTFDFWHDRAVFHFLVDPVDRESYLKRLSRSLGTEGHAVIATFALDGPEKCSGLDVRRYSPESLSDELGSSFDLVTHRFHIHHTPWGRPQSFQYSLFRKQE
ncbi:class I SAM-dependent methyltransferase [Ruegeria profundi]|uniref:class I SAM-dependent methyltransferase n=1 Tax=Ruegeria profundi TaxID=1685378 RepID=UPI001CD23678|nr:class I SAM-dependent methyltransferase [Ruegeria profundi]MCA0928841.1 class I SAM-dependent methyltransferase [Ruegeria profundi]